MCAPDGSPLRKIVLLRYNKIQKLLTIQNWQKLIDLINFRFITFTFHNFHVAHLIELIHVTYPIKRYFYFKI